MKTILVTGSNGQLGNELQLLAKNSSDLQFVFTDVADLDITNPEAVAAIFEKQQFDFCINCAAYTAVDKAESEQELAHLLNAEAVDILGKSCDKQGTKLIQISTDFVFDGTNHVPYLEDHNTSPLSVYGSTKQQGETATLAHNGIVIRTSWLYSSFGNNFVKTMKRLGTERDSLSVIFDQIGTPTYAADLAHALVAICNQEQRTDISGIFHYSNEGCASWYDFAKAVFHIAGINCKLSPITTEQYPTPAARPHYSVLNKSKIKTTFNIEIPYWIDSLKDCMEKMK